MNEPIKRLYRTKHDRMFAGVCGGLGRHFHIDPVWIRLLFVLFFFAGGSAFFVYVLMWIIVPPEPTI